MDNPELNNQSQTPISEDTLGQTTEMKTAPGIIHEPVITHKELSQLQQVQPYQDIIDFLAKPVYIGNATFTTSSTRGASLFSHKPSDTITTGGIPLWTSKLNGFYSMRGTFVYDLIINATPFHAGALLFNFFPSASILSLSEGMHSTDLNAKSQWPGSIIANINKDHYVVKVPFISVSEMYPMKSTASAPDWGRFSTFVWSPLVSGAAAANSITVSIWGHWEDVTLGPVFPQSSMARSKRNNSVVIRRKNKSPLSKEENHGKGPISSILSSVSVAADAFKDVPSISPLAGTVSWAASIASGVASMFGFSAPRTTAGPKLYVGGSLFSRNANSDKFDPSAHLATMNDGKVALIEGKSVYSGDEMSFSFIKSRPAYIDNFQYSTSNTVGQRIYSYALSPVYARTSSTYDGLACTQYTPVGALARQFLYFTGGLKLRIKLFKTAFHAGTLVFAYVPNDTSTSYTLLQTSPLNRYVLDIQTEDSFEIELPYQSEFPWLNVFDYLGSLHVYAFTPLRAPESVSSTIDITVEILGADDLVFANPCLQGVTPLSPQGALEDVNEESQFNVGASSTFQDPLEFSETCIGEQIVSVKQLINRYYRVQSSVPTTQFSTNPSFRIRDNVIGCAIRVVGSGTTTYTDLYGTPIDFWAFCYAFRRGGTRWGILRNGNATRSGLKTAYVPSALGAGRAYVNVGTNIADSIPNSNTTPATTSAYWSPPNMRPGKEGGELVSVPFMNKYLVAPNEPFINEAASNVYQPPHYITFQSEDLTSDTTLIRSVDDHFQFKYFIGIPLCYDSSL